MNVLVLCVRACTCVAFALLFTTFVQTWTNICQRCVSVIPFALPAFLTTTTNNNNNNDVAVLDEATRCVLITLVVAVCGGYWCLCMLAFVSVCVCDVVICSLLLLFRVLRFIV